MFSSSMSLIILAVVIVAAAVFLFRLLHLDSISSMKQKITDLVNADKRTDLIRTFYARLCFEIDHIEKHLGAIKAAFRGKDPSPDYTNWEEIKVLIIAMIIGLLSDWLVQFALFARMPFLPLLVWFLLGLPMALGVALIAEAVLYALTNDPDRPFWSIRVCRNATVVTGVISAVALSMYLFGRTVPASSVTDWIINLISGALWVLGEVLGICCGFTAAWVRHLSRGWTSSKKYFRLQKALQPLVEFRGWLEKQAADLGISLTTVNASATKPTIVDEHAGEPPKDVLRFAPPTAASGERS